MAKEKSPKAVTNNLDDLMTQFQKSYGVEAVQRGSNCQIAGIKRWNVESPLISYILGGGTPVGRHIEIYGPPSAGKTSLACYLAGEAQRQGETVMYIDAEHSADLDYAETLGLVREDVFFCQPSSGEQALSIALDTVLSGLIKIIIIDSVSALTPQAEIDGEMGDQQMGLQARMLSKAMRKLTEAISNNGVTILWINQIRMKIGVMFGCVHADTQVCFVDGSSIPIRKVVENKIKGLVWAYNENSGGMEPREIINWHFNGVVKNSEDFVHIQTTSIDGHGRFGITVTRDHNVLTAGGWKKAREIDLKDQLISKYESVINGTVEDFLWGCVVGDSTISIRHRNTGCIKFQDSENPEYLNWKIGKLSNAFDFKKNGNRFESNYCYEFVKIKKEVGNRDPRLFLSNHYSNLGLAMWFMDDAHLDLQNSHTRYILSVKRFKANKDILFNIQHLFKSVIGVYPTINFKNGSFSFSKRDTCIIAEKIQSYVPNSMQYKLPLEYRGNYKDFDLIHDSKTLKDCVNVVEIRSASKRQMRQKGRYDISVDGLKNYMVGGSNNGVIIHNSPETTSGGKALLFYSSIRLEVRKVEFLQKGNDDPHGILTRVKAVKNKTAAPMRKGEVTIIFGKGFQVEGEYLNLAVKHDIIKKSGSWYSYGEERIGQGRDKAIDFLQNNDDIYNDVKSRVDTILNPEPEDDSKIETRQGKKVSEENGDISKSMEDGELTISGDKWKDSTV